MKEAACKFCSTSLKHTFADLGATPLCQRHVTPEQFYQAEPIYPLHAYVCEKCYLVQLAHAVPREDIFNDQYAYFSSFSDSWLQHARTYTEQMRERFGLNESSLVMEAASNDGYLLQYFVKAGVPVVGIEPTANTAAEAEKKGVRSTVRFLGKESAREITGEFGKADLALGNNVLAHVPQINDFVAGLAELLKPTGVLTMEFPHLLELTRHNQFDTIYHEHWSYLSFTTVREIFAHHGLKMFDVQSLPTHGGSLRVFATPAPLGGGGGGPHEVSDNVAAMLACEADAGMRTLGFYEAFAENVRETKRKLLSFLIDAKRAGKHVVGYGAPGKGNTLLNYCGIGTDMLDYTVDRSPHKYGNYLPGSRIPIRHPDAIAETKPDYVLILPWNLKDEISKQMSHIREWGGKFVVPIPQVQVMD